MVSQNSAWAPQQAHPVSKEGVSVIERALQTAPARYRILCTASWLHIPPLSLEMEWGARGREELWAFCEAYVLLTIWADFQITERIRTFILKLFF